MMTLAVIFLGVIALSSVVQAAFMIGLAREGRRLAERLDEIERRFESELRPTLQNLSRLSASFAEVGDILTNQARRIDGFMGDTITKLEEATTTLREVVL